MSESEIFKAAVKLPVATRNGYLDQVCGTDRELRQEVESLLAAHESAGAFLERPGAKQEATAAYAGTAEGIGAVIAGRYKLLEAIGEGGMGAVFVAEQTEPVRRKVALKLIKPGMDSRAVLARFEAERQALALMDHPSIAKVFDGGLTAAGRPFFVMEYVKGVPITDYCDSVRLGICERLALFAQVCQAVQHAHQKGVIHRDLKPSNILVAPYDGKPVPKVIDFGLAKAVHQSLTERTLHTAHDTVLGTPLYMSPEQAQLNNLDVDTRSDIYSLGVLLYELLTGTTPLEKQRFNQAAWDEVRRVIREEEPPRPSARLSSTQTLPSLAACRGSEPAKLTKLMRGELDWIVMKALEKDRTRRYETANGFARDVQRYLADEVVEARPPSAGYRFKKFVRRNKGRVIAVSLVLLALLTGMAGTAWQAFRAEQARADESTQRAIAVEHRTRAEQARDRTRDVLDAMTSSVTGDSLSTQKEISADQKKFLTEVLTYYREFAGEQADVEQTRARTANAADRVGLIEHRLGHKEQGIAAFQMARDGYRTLAADFPAVPAYRHNLANSHNSLGILLADLGKRAEAEEQFRQALAIQKKLAADFPTVSAYGHNLANSHNSLGVLLADLGKRAESEAQYRQALAIQEKLAADFPIVPNYQQELATSHNNLGNLLDRLGKRADAEEQYRKSLAIQERLAADFPAVPEYRQDLATCHDNLGQMLQGLRRRAEAEEQYRQALAIQEKLVVDFPTVPAYRQNLAGSHFSLGSTLLNNPDKEAEAAEQYRQALAIQEKLATAFPAEPAYQIELGASYCNYGILVRDGGRASESLYWFDKAIAMLTPVHRAEPRDVTTQQFLRNSHANRAGAYDALKKHADAVHDWDRAVELSPPGERPEMRASRATSRLQAGMVAEAMAEVAELTKLSGWDAGPRYDFACVYAVASRKVAEKKQEYADRAMELLQNAIAAGYKDVTHMKKDKDLDALRERSDFKKLMEELNSTSVSEPTTPKTKP